jgi:hypothetical protein
MTRISDGESYRRSEQTIVVRKLGPSYDRYGEENLLRGLRFNIEMRGSVEVG